MENWVSRMNQQSRTFILQQARSRVWSPTKSNISSATPSLILEMSWKFWKQSHTNLDTNSSVTFLHIPSWTPFESELFSGNLVTCQWWDQIWLNEGFATLFEYLLVDNVYPVLRMKDHFNIQKVQNALKADSLQSTRAMFSNAETPQGISGLFDRVAYDKCRSMSSKNRARFI
jgi:hypothetical protein